MKIEEIKKYTTEGFKAIHSLTKTLLEPNKTQFTEELFKEILVSNNSHLFFSFDENEITGMLTIGIYKSPTGVKAWIEDVVVDTKHQGKGIGKALVKHAIMYAKEKGADSLMLTSRPTRKAANKLYQSLNFVQKETNIYKMTFNLNI